MYQVIGIQRNTKQRLLSTPQSACEALAAYQNNLKDYRSMKIIVSTGEEISLAELRKLADSEADGA